MGANSGTLGVYRHGSAWVAQYVDANGEKHQRRFADKWSAAQWRTERSSQRACCKLDKWTVMLTCFARRADASSIRTV